ncbi:MAG: choice-of-anchor V domain-containing protein [Candidatus Zixiibacteriota bacterium]
MKHIRQIPFIIIIIAVSGIAWGYSSGVPGGYTGAPDEENCTVCHSSFPVNSGIGTVSITVPAFYDTGASYDITVTLTHEGRAFSGFQATVLDSNNLPIGQIEVIDEMRTQMIPGTLEREYITHTWDGLDGESTEIFTEWIFRWTAPAFEAGRVTFYAAGNAADGLDWLLGDYIYTTSSSVNHANASCCVGITGNIDGSSDNQIDISDAVYMIDYMFSNPPGPAPPCMEEADVDGESGIDIGDIVYLIDYMFSNPPGPVPVNCQ